MLQRTLKRDPLTQEITTKRSIMTKTRTKYGQHILRNAFKTHHQLEGLSPNGDEMARA